MEMSYLMSLYMLFGSVSVGSFWAAAIGEYKGMHVRLRKRCAVTAFVSLILAVAAIFLYLPHREHAFYVFSNLGSWLARETLFLFLFGAVVFVYVVQPMFGLPARKYVGLLGLVIGSAATVSTGMVQVMALAEPAWNTPIIPLIYVASTFVLSVFVFGVASTIRSSEELVSAQVFGKVIKVGAVAIVIHTLLAFAYLGYLYGVPEVSVDKLLFGDLSPFFWMRFIVGSLIPLVLVGVHLATGERVISRKHLAFTCLLYVAAGFLMERALIHWVSEPISLFDPAGILG